MPTATKSKSGKKSSRSGKKKGGGGGFDNLARNVATSAGRPITFVVALAIILIWGLTGPIFQYNDTWQLVINTGTTIITFLMVFLIQNTQNRDAIALQLKIDELIRALDAAHDDVISLEDKSEEELEEIKKRYLDLAKEADKHLQ